MSQDLLRDRHHTHFESGADRLAVLEASLCHMVREYDELRGEIRRRDIELATLRQVAQEHHVLLDPTPQPGPLFWGEHA